MSHLRSWPAILLALVTAAAAAPAPLDVMPVPAEVRSGSGRLAVEAGFVLTANLPDPRLAAAIATATRHWEERTGLTAARDVAGSRSPLLEIKCAAAGAEVPQLGDDESYTLIVTPGGAKLQAAVVVGALRGLQTWQQLLAADEQGWFVPEVMIHDRPRFPWRGLLIDVARHWMPPAVIERNLDAMAAVKLNVLHLHLTDDQGFRVESKKFPRLQELGSDGHYFTQDQIRQLVAYAAARGIRIVPEFDVPGHATSWVVGYPELASAPGPYAIERRWGVHDPVLDPTNEQVYPLLDGFFGEMAALFPDAYFHIGGDENNGKQWSANPHIQAFITAHGLKDNAGLHAYFNQRLSQILAHHGKQLVGWDEILHPDLPTTSVVQSWRGAASLADAARRGFSGLLSNGYYLDHSDSARRHYAVDPLPANTTLSAAEAQHVLGGEACEWGEWVTAETIDTRIWPRAAAIAERLWSPRETTDDADLYRRLAIVSQRLEEAGALHKKNSAALLRRFAGALPADQFENLRDLADFVEAGSLGVRARAQRSTNQFTPLTGFADCARPESDAARELVDAIDRCLFAPPDAEPPSPAALSERLTAWRDTAHELATHLSGANPRVQELLPLIEALRDACEVGAGALINLSDNEPLAEASAARAFDVLARAGRPNPVGVTLPILPALRRIVAAASVSAQRAALSPADWRALVESRSAPPTPTRGEPKKAAPPAAPKS